MLCVAWLLGQSKGLNEPPHDSQTQVAALD
jgi:hypothetical protein